MEYAGVAPLTVHVYYVLCNESNPQINGFRPMLGFSNLFDSDWDIVLRRFSTVDDNFVNDFVMYQNQR